MRRSTGEVAVSDVLGSVLLVGITVVMAGAFGAVLLSYKGPQDAQHTQLSVRVGPGADGDWGTNDAELVIRHLGGEPIKQSDMTVRYVDAAGTHTVTPTFAGGKLSVGGEWVQVISATAGSSVDVLVRVVEAGGTTVLSSGSVSAGGSGATLNYVSSVAFSSGSIDPAFPLVGAQAAGTDDANAYALLKEGSVGGTPSTITLPASTASNSGASNSNVLSSDDNRAALDNSGEWVQGTTFTGVPAQYAVSALSIGMEARALQQTVTHVATLTPGTASGGTTVSTLTTIPVTTGEFYVAAIANGLSTPRSVTGVSGPSGVTWQFLQSQTNSAGNGRLEVWVGKGTPSILGVVTATFSGTVDRAAISVSRYSNVDLSGTNPTDAVQAFLAGENAVSGGSTAASLGPITGTASTGVFFAAVNGITSNGAAGCTFTTPVNERSDVDGGSNRVQLCTAGGPAAASNTLGATLAACSGSCTGSNVLDWQAIVLTIKPTALPSAVLSYTFAGCTCSTTLTQALTATDATYTQSIIGDRAWTLADLANIAVRVTYPTDTGSDVEVDRVYLSLTYTTTATTYNTQADLSFTGVPNLSNHVFQMRYKATGDTFRVYAMTGAVERACPGNLASGLYTVFTCTLSTAEYNAGAPVVRIKDQTPAGTSQGNLFIEYARVSTS